MKKRWICLFVENEIGVLAYITGLFSDGVIIPLSKSSFFMSSSYNLWC